MTSNRNFKGRNLITQRFPAAGRHQDQAILLRQHTFDGSLLIHAEIVITKLVFENFLMAKGDQPKWERDESWKTEFELD